MMFDLRNWLRRTPKPDTLRLRMPDGEERTVQLTGGRTRWTVAEEAVRTSGASSVEAIDTKGHILRSARLENEDLDDEPDEPRGGGGADAKRDAQLLSRDRREIASICDAQGRRQNEAYAAGAAAASQSQDKLLEMVENLTQHFSLALTNLHTMSVNLSNVLQAAANPEEPSSGRNDSLLALLASMVQAKGSLPMATPPNGEKK
jgi:hypothetical protein